MPNFYPLPRWALRASLLLAPLGAAQAQAPVITAVMPMANARAAARTSPLTVNFNQPLTPASAGALKVFSAQRGGLRSRGTTPAVVNGNALSFAPTNYDFRPGETVQYTVTTAAAGTGGPLARGRVGQFTAAVGGTGNGVFVAGTDAAVGSHPTAVTIGDVDGDGDLDLLTANYVSTVSVRLNDGTGTFSGVDEVAIGIGVNNIRMGDVDNDGDLDLLTSNASSRTVSVRLNSGSGAFSGSQEVSVGAGGPFSVAVGDVDNDGDLDLLTDNGLVNGTVNVRLNGGTGPLAPATAALTLFPNPATGTTTLTGAAPHAPLTVLDALGRTLLTAAADAAGTARLALPAGLSAGVYLVRSGGQVRRLAVE